MGGSEVKTLCASRGETLACIESAGAACAMDVMGLTSMQGSGNTEDSTWQVYSIRAAFSVPLLVMPPVSRQS